MDNIAKDLQNIIYKYVHNLYMGDVISEFKNKVKYNCLLWEYYYEDSNSSGDGYTASNLINILIRRNIVPLNKNLTNYDLNLIRILQIEKPY